MKSIYPFGPEDTIQSAVNTNVFGYGALNAEEHFNALATVAYDEIETRLKPSHETFHRERMTQCYLLTSQQSCINC